MSNLSQNILLVLITICGLISFGVFFLQDYLNDKIFKDDEIVKMEDDEPKLAETPASKENKKKDNQLFKSDKEYTFILSKYDKVDKIISLENLGELPTDFGAFVFDNGWITINIKNIDIMTNDEIKRYCLIRLNDLNEDLKNEIRFFDWALSKRDHILKLKFEKDFKERLFFKSKKCKYELDNSTIYYKKDKYNICIESSYPNKGDFEKIHCLKFYRNAIQNKIDLIDRIIKENV